MRRRIRALHAGGCRKRRRGRGRRAWGDCTGRDGWSYMAAGGAELAFCGMQKLAAENAEKILGGRGDWA